MNLLKTITTLSAAITATAVTLAASSEKQTVVLQGETFTVDTLRHYKKLF